METGWPKEDSRIENQKLVNLLNYSNQQYHNIQINMEERGELVVKFKKKNDQTCQGLLGWLQCIFPFHGVVSSLGGIAFRILMLVSLIVYVCHL